MTTLTIPLQGGELIITVTILKERQNYGRTDYLVTPANGSGQAWVREDRLKVKGGK